MRGVARALALIAVAAVQPATAAAEELRANPVSWTPADAKAGAPVDIVLQLYGEGVGVHGVEVVIREAGEERRFPTIDLGSGQYRTAITFPHSGGWDVRVSYHAAAHGGADEILLGKGAIRIEGPPAASGRRPATVTPPATLAGALALVLGLTGLAVAAFRSASRGSPALPG